MIVVLMVAAGAPWESEALRVLDDSPGTVVLKRCVDVDDLLAAATAGRAEAAVVSLDSPGLDAAAIDHLRAHGVRPVAVAPSGRADAAGAHAARIGVDLVVAEDDLGRLPDRVAEPERRTPPPRPGPPADPAAAPAGPPVTAGLHPSQRPTTPPPAAPPTGPPATGRVLAVWGPTGAPGRTTVAIGLAAEAARRRRRTLLLDADPYGGTLGQQLGILEEVSGLLAAARLSTSGALREQFTTVPRMVGPDLAVVTGLPRAERWPEVRTGAVEHLVEVARTHGDVVIDTGFCLEQDSAYDLGGRPGRNQMTLESLAVADEVVAVGSADPVGLSRLARGLVELAEACPGTPVRVVVNRMRPALGWSDTQVTAMLGDFARPVGVSFLPEDRAALDRAAVSGRAVVETGDGALTRALAALYDAAVPTPAGDGASVRRRRAGRARRR